MRKYRIIIVENDEDEQMFMKEGFDAAGLFEIVAQVKNGDALMDWISGNRRSLPDLILTDLNMPGKNGYDIMDELKADPTLAHIPIIITSTSSTRSTMEKCFEKGAADFLVKPDTFIEYEGFVRKLHAMVEDKELVK